MVDVDVLTADFSAGRTWTGSAGTDYMIAQIQRRRWEQKSTDREKNDQQEGRSAGSLFSTATYKQARMRPAAVAGLQREKLSKKFSNISIDSYR